MDEVDAENASMYEALRDATAHLAGAVSAFEAYASRKGKRPAPDPFFSTRLADFNNALVRARVALAKHSETGAQNQREYSNEI